MRLGKVLEILNTNLPKIIPKTIETSSGNIEIKDAHDLFIALEALRQLPSLESSATAIIGNLPRPDRNNSIVLNATIYNKLSPSLHNISSIGKHLQQAIFQSIPKVEDGIVYLKLPPENTIEQMAKDLDLIDKSFHQVFNGYDSKVSYQFKGVESGSIWLVFKIAGSTSLFIGLLNKAMALAAKGLELKKQSIEVSSAEIDLDLKKKDAEIKKLLLDNYAKRLTQEFMNDANPKNNSSSMPEFEQRLTHAIRTLSTIFKRGGDVEIPLITASKTPIESKQNSEVSALLNATPSLMLASPQDNTEDPDSPTE